MRTRSGGRPGLLGWQTFVLCTLVLCLRGTELGALAFAKGGHPGRVIAALQLLSTLLSIMLLGDGWPSCSGGGGLTSLGGSTDNQGNSHAVAKFFLANGL